nr:hypothetical protein [Bacillus haikouensis]
MIGVQDEDSCGRSGQCETPQACRGGSRATRGKRSLARKSLAALRTYASEIVRLYIVVYSFCPSLFFRVFKSTQIKDDSSVLL